MATFNDRAPRTFNMRASRAMLAACLFYAAFGGLIQWFPIWLIEERGFTGEQLGLVISLAGIGRIVAGPLTSAWADGRKDRRAPIQLLAAISLLALGALPRLRSWWAMWRRACWWTGWAMWASGGGWR